MRDAFDCYTLFEKHIDAFNSSAMFSEFIEKVNIKYLESYIGGWAEMAFETMKAGKKTYRPLYFPKASKFSDLFDKAIFIPTDSKVKSGYFIGGNAAFSKHVGGKRGWSERTENTRCHYGAKFYGTYVTPNSEVDKAVKGYWGKYDSFEAIRREDGILITGRCDSYIGSTWIALLDLSEDIKSLFDDETKEMIEREKQAEIDAWGESTI